MLPSSPAVTTTRPYAFAVSKLPEVLLPTHVHAEKEEEESTDDEIEGPEAWWLECNEAEDDRDVRGELLISSAFSEKLSLGVLLLLANMSSRLLFVLDHDGRAGDGSQLTPPLGHGTATSTSLQ